MELIPALFLFLICGTVSVLTVAGNILVMLAFVKEKKLRRWNNYFLINLAVADTLVGAVSMPFYTIYLYEGQWTFGAVICDLWLTLDYTMCTSSCLSILVICIDRYWSLAYPITYRQYMSTQVVMCLIIPTWAVPILLYGIGIFAIHQLGDRDIEEGKCYVHYQDDPVFTIVSTVINYWAIIVAILILYYKIYKITKFFWRRKKPVRAAPVLSKDLYQGAAKDENAVKSRNGTSGTNQETSSDSDDSQYGDDDQNEVKKCDVKAKDNIQPALLLSIPNASTVDADTSVSPATTTSTAVTSCSTYVTVEDQTKNKATIPAANPKSFKGNSKAMRVLTAVLSSFVICWTPYAVLVIILSFDASLIPNGVFYVSYGLCYINSLLNPSLYAYANEVFRRTFWKIIRCQS